MRRWYGKSLNVRCARFFIQLGLAVPGYSAMLAIYYVMSICYGIDHDIIAKQYEVIMNAIVLIPTATTATIAVVNEMYFSESATCWIGDRCQSLGNCPNGNI